MNLDKAFVLLFASLNAVAGFAPAGQSTVVSRQASGFAFVPSNVVRSSASALFSEVEEAAEPAVEEAPEEPAFDTSIYIGNVSFGEYRCNANHGDVSEIDTIERMPNLMSHLSFVANCCEKTDTVESELRAAFSEHGNVQKVQMPLNRETVSAVLFMYLFRLFFDVPSSILIIHIHIIQNK